MGECPPSWIEKILALELQTDDCFATAWCHTPDVAIETIFYRCMFHVRNDDRV